MSLDINGSTPQVIDYNGDDVLRVTYNGTTVFGQGYDELWYTTSDGQILQSSASTRTTLGSTLVSHTYENGVGKIKVKKEIQYVSANVFGTDSNVESFTITDKVTELRAFDMIFPPDLTEITYQGTKTMWANVNGSTGFINTVHCIDGDITLNNQE